ncbi:hypothetical protein V1294_005497 [Bradyrhizobium sp. AZCC 1678]
MSCCINRRKPVPERTDRGGTLRYAWLRAPPLRRMQKITSKPRLGCLTQKASYEGGQRRTCAVPTIDVSDHALKMVGTLRFAHPTKFSNLRRDQIALGRHERFVGNQFLAEHAGFFARGLGREAPQQDQ